MSVTATTTQQLEQGTAKFWIVLVGVNRYKDSNIFNLKYCANDCKELSEALKVATEQFHQTEIISLYDGGNLLPERSQMIASIQQFRLAKPEDTVLFYFSGHGYLDANSRPVLCVADTSLQDLENTGLKLDFLLSELSQCQAQRQLVWLDACQEREQQQNSFSRANPASKLDAVLREQAEKSRNFHAMLSCDRQERSWEIEELKHGLFTYCLIEGLRGKAANSRGQIDADSLFNYVERSSKKLIEYKKSPLDSKVVYKGMSMPGGVGQSCPPPKHLKVKRLPANASQTPQRIVKGGGELMFIIGLAQPNNNRKALIVDRLSSSQADISLCKILQAIGNFEVKYRYLRDKQQWNLEQDIASYLDAECDRTILLYLSGKIESTGQENYDLVCDSENRINLNWLSKQLNASSVKEIILIADLTETGETTLSLESILELDYTKPLCLITAYSTQVKRKAFLHQLVTSLETAGKAEGELWVTSLITQLQQWSIDQSTITIKPWLGTIGVIEILSVEVQRSYNEIFDIEVCPYKSLEAFTQNDAYFFHGREELITKIIKKLESNSFLAVVGASGSGKSSVVRAGVIPKLVANGLNTSQSRQTHTCQTWVMLPGDNPFLALAKVISPNKPKLLEGVLHAGVKGFVNWLRQQPQAISVLAIDQFEELFTLTAEKERIDFIRLIIAAAERAGDCFKVIITLRGDFINECLNLSEIAPLMEQNEILVPVKSSRLEDKQYRQIIAQPAQKVGLGVEEGLIAILLEELKDGSLPLLQYALEELWQKRSQGKLTLKDYQQYIGRLGQFLSDKAEATYKNLNPLQQECAQSIFLSLVYLAQEQDKTNKDTRRRLLKSDLRVNKYKDTLDDTLQALVDARLIVVSGEESDRSLVTDGDRQNALAVADEVQKSTRDRDKDTVEIAHEILIDNWKTLKWWIDKNRDKYRLFKEIDRKAKDWQQNNQQEGFLLSKGALAKYEEFYGKYANELSSLSDRFMDASIQTRDKADRLAKRRQRQIIGGLTGGIFVLGAAFFFALGQLRRANIKEIDALSNNAEALLESNQELDALVTGLKVGIDTKFSKLENKIQILGRLQNIFHEIKELNRLESHNDSVTEVEFSPNGQTIASASQDSTVKLWNLQGKLLHTLQGHDGYVIDIEFSPNGQTIISASDDNTVKLWNLQGELLHTLQGHNNSISSVRFSPDGQTIASGSWDDTVKLWNLQGELLYTLQGHTENIRDLEFSPDGRTIVSASQDSTVKLWNLQGELLHTLQGHKDITLGIAEIRFSPDGTILASADDSDTVKLWNLQGELLDTLRGHDGNINELEFSSDGKTIVSASTDNTVRLWNIKGQLLHTFQGHNSNVQDIKFSPNEQIIASASEDNTVRLWNANKKLLHTFQGHSDNFSRPSSIKDVEFSPSGQIIAYGSWDDTVKLWSLKEGLLHTLQGHNDNVDDVKFSPDGQTIISTSWDNTIKIWNIRGNLLHTLQGHSNKINDVELSPDGQTIASASRDKTVRLWNIRGNLLHTLQGSDFSIVGNAIGIRDIEFSPDGQIIASAGWNKSIKLWNLEGKLLYTLKSHRRDVEDVEFSPDGQTIASASEDNTIKLWNTKGNLLHTFKGHNSGIRDVEFSPDGQTIASASQDNTIKLWNTKGNLLYTLKSHGDEAIDVEFSPDGQTIASASQDNTIKLWNTKGNLLYTLRGHSSWVNSIEFSPNGKNIASSSYDDTVKLWSLDLDEVMSRGCNWVRDYLENNPNVSEEDRKICDGI